jgi:hypothetical protein
MSIHADCRVHDADEDSQFLGFAKGRGSRGVYIHMEECEIIINADTISSGSTRKSARD